LVVRNSTTTKRVSPRDDDTTTQAKAKSPVQDDRSSSSSTRRPRALRPLLFPPSFSPSALLPTKNAPIAVPDDDRRNQRELQERNDSKAAETDGTGGSSTTTTVELEGLAPGTLKADIRHAFQHLGEIKRILMHPRGRAEVAFADAAGVRRVLHAYAEQPLRVRGQEIVVFRKRHADPSRVGVGVASPGLVPVRYEEDDYGGIGRSIIVANFPAGTTREELSEAFEPLGKYERLVMRMCFFSFTPCHFFFFFFWVLSADSYVVFRSWFEIRVFRVFERRSRR
jgi:hypothetical protein